MTEQSGAAARGGRLGMPPAVKEEAKVQGKL